MLFRAVEGILCISYVYVIDVGQRRENRGMLFIALFDLHVDKSKDAFLCYLAIPQDEILQFHVGINE